MGRIIIATESCVRESNTTAYLANDAWANDDTAPTAYLFEEVAGQSGTIVDAVFVSSNDPATLLQGELWLFDGTTTVTNDNAELALSDADMLKWIGTIPFTLVTSTDGVGGTNSCAHVIDLNIAFDCSNKAGLYALVKVKNVYTPASAETLNVRLKVRREAG